MLKTLLPYTLLLGALVGCQTTPSMQQGKYSFPNYSQGAPIEAMCSSYLAEAQGHERRIQELPSKDASTVLSELDAMTRRYEDALAPLLLLSSVHPDKSVREAADACDVRYQAFARSFRQNQKIYALLQQVQPADDIDRRFVREHIGAFEDAGAGLSSDKQSMAQSLATEIGRLSQEFERRIRDDKTQLALSDAELLGVPVKVWNTSLRDANGRYLLKVDDTTYGPVIEHAVNSQTREKMWRAFQSLGGPENLKILEELVQRRLEYAQLFGFPSYADFVLRRRMVQRATRVHRLLDTVKRGLAKREASDYQLLREAKATYLNQALNATVLQRWDVNFYTQRERRVRYQFDQEQFRAYFPPQASLDFVFLIAQRMFGVQFTAQSQSLWHPDARAYEVTSSDGKQHIGTLYVDLYARADKYSRAAVWPLRSSSTQVVRTPVVALATSFGHQGLTLSELETLLHEFGHALHALFSTTRYASQSGSNTQLDFLEVPSQMLEEWVYDPKVLELFQQVCASCRPVPAALIARAAKARDFVKGIGVGRQILLANYDITLHGKQAVEPMALWARMEQESPLGYVAGTMFPAGFSYVAGGYASGYYGYLWSQALAEDLRTAFSSDKLSAPVGHRFRTELLAHGGQLAPAELMRRFLGRESNGEALFRALNRE